MTPEQALKEALAAFSIGGTVGDSTGNEIPLESAILDTLASLGFSLEGRQS